MARSQRAGPLDPHLDPDHPALHPESGHYLVSGLPRQVGTDGNFQVFEVTAHQRELVAQNAVKVLTRQGAVVRDA